MADRLRVAARGAITEVVFDHPPINIYDVATRKRLHVVEYTPPPEATGSVSCLRWAPDGSWLAVGRFDGSSCIVRCDGT